jgi:hypothetical protein
MSYITNDDPKDINRGSKDAGKNVSYIGENRTKIDDTTRYGRGDAMKFLNSVKDGKKKS